MRGCCEFCGIPFFFPYSIPIGEAENCIDVSMEKEYIEKVMVQNAGRLEKER